jgi:hypothetical protein
MGRRGGKGRRRRREGADRPELGSGGLERGDVAGEDKELCKAFGQNPRPLS